MFDNHQLYIEHKFTACTLGWSYQTPSILPIELILTVNAVYQFRAYHHGGE